MRRVRRRSAGPATAPVPTALLLIDVINPLQFDEAPAFMPALAATAGCIAALKAGLGAQGIPAVYVNDHLPGTTWRSDFAAAVEHCSALGGGAATLARALAPGPADHTLFKPRHSAFHATALELLLTELGARALVVCGLATDLCVQYTAMDAFERGFRLWVPADCSLAASRARHRAALDWMARSLQAHVAPAAGTLVADARR
jgi:nicotinamidase-related amidase